MRTSSPHIRGTALTACQSVQQGNLGAEGAEGRAKNGTNWASASPASPPLAAGRQQAWSSARQRSVDACDLSGVEQVQQMGHTSGNEHVLGVCGAR